MEKIAETAVCGGRHQVFRHHSEVLGCEMAFALFVPAGDKPKQAVMFLSGLTCTWENAATKAGAQAVAAALDMIVIFPDTSPRGKDVADDESYAIGQGAGFYMTATKAPYEAHYRMDRYVCDELPKRVADIAPLAPGKMGITGHSMGGHGALTLAMKNPDIFGSVSAFAPIAAPMKAPWGRDIFTAYLGDDEAQWAQYDACELMASHGWTGEMLVDVGAADPFLTEQLKPELLRQAAAAHGIDLTLCLREGYDHSYYFVTSFIGDHLRWHHARLCAPSA